MQLFAKPRQIADVQRQRRKHVAADTIERQTPGSALGGEAVLQPFHEGCKRDVGAVTAEAVVDRFEAVEVEDRERGRAARLPMSSSRTSSAARLPSPVSASTNPGASVAAESRFLRAVTSAMRPRQRSASVARPVIVARSSHQIMRPPT